MDIDTKAAAQNLADNLSQRDLAAEMADNVENVVSIIRDRSTTKVEGVAKGVVVGILGAIVGMVMLVLLLVLLFRLVDVVLPPDDGSWSTWLLFGAVLALAGVFFWRKRPKLGPTT